MTTYLSLNRRYTPSKPLEQCYSGSLLIVEFMVMNKLTDYCLTEIKTTKSLFKTPQQQDSYHQLTRSDQTAIFRLRTGHNRLNQHLNRVMKIISSLIYSCGEAEQDTVHILQTCKNHQALRKEIWPLPTTLQEKLYGPADALQKTTRFVAETEIQV